MSTDIVRTEQAQAPALSSNPFAKASPDYGAVMAGNALIEAERATAEAQGKLVMAKRFPRDTGRAFQRAMDACRRPSFAKDASYAFPRGGQTVTGPSIRLAEMLASCYGNIEYGIRELSQAEGYSEMEAYCWDMESNTISTQRFTVQHKSLNKQKTQLTDPRDIYERVANDGARRLRARILAVLPPDLVEAAEEECKRTLAGGNGEPLIDRVRRMVDEFGKLGVPADAITARIGHSTDTMVADELVDLRRIFVSIRDGHTKATDWFTPKADAGQMATAALKAPAAGFVNAAAAQGPNTLQVAHPNVTSPSPLIAPTAAAVPEPAPAPTTAKPRSAKPKAEAAPAPVTSPLTETESEELDV